MIKVTSNISIESTTLAMLISAVDTASLFLNNNEVTKKTTALKGRMISVSGYNTTITETHYSNETAFVSLSNGDTIELENRAMRAFLRRFERHLKDNEAKRLATLGV